MQKGGILKVSVMEDCDKNSPYPMAFGPPFPFDIMLPRRRELESTSHFGKLCNGKVVGT